jgi:hypothetical protein
MEFNLEEAKKAANEALRLKRNKGLSDVEVIIFTGAWQNQTYDEIAAKNPHYGSAYISRDAAPTLWILLSEALGETVKKNNFKEALKRWWEKKLVSGQISLTQNISTNQSSKNGVDNFSPPDFYVERPPIESLCYKALFQPGALIRIKASRQMGKTELMVKVLDYAKKQGYRSVYIHLRQPEESVIQDLDQFLRWLCTNVSRQLQQSLQVKEYWDEEMSSNDNCSAYFQEYLLERIDCPLVLGLDAVDRLFPHLAMAQDFFGMLRAWHEDGKILDNWKKVRLIVSHSTEVYIPLDINYSPFNVGLTIPIPEFTPNQVAELAGKHGHSLSQTEVTLLINIMGGHPGLVTQALIELKKSSNPNLEQLLKDAPTEAGIYGNHLRETWQELQENPALVAAMKKVVDTTDTVRLESKEAYQLDSLGLVSRKANDVTPRCELYRQYFRSRLANT